MLKIWAIPTFGVNNSDITLNFGIDEISIRYLWKVTCYFGAKEPRKFVSDKRMELKKLVANLERSLETRALS